ncbi:DEKNAAC103413 [Brettanomyces naardenensis]|uniref:Signal recognition particle subunit SRP72 n=1 Tax=Brettanomyces naardenensis TaxID=13370 RepID=A0A448YN02_BRENA|nr:DEKNAAC103413 [Brettanomyces naardenensis]
MKVFSESDSHRQVYHIGRDVLKRDPTNVQALKQCLVALINMDNYEAAVKLIDSHKDLLGSDDASDKLLLLEKAYIYYKIGNDGKLEELIPLGKTVRGFQHVLAQHYYRVGRSGEALEIYQKLLTRPQGEEADLSVNERAVLSQIKYEDPSVSVPLKSTANAGSYDQISNEGLIKLRERNYDEALGLFEKALQIAKQNLREYDSESKFAELAPIQVQIAYVKQLLGDTDEAESVLAGFQVSEVKDQVLKLLITNNLVSLRDISSANPALVYRELGFPSSLHNTLDRLTIPQTKALQRNELLLAQRSGKDITLVAQKHALQFPGSAMGLALSTLAKTGIELSDLSFENNDKKLFRYSMRHPEDLPFALLACQVSVAYGNLQNAAMLLENVISTDGEVLVDKPAVAPLLFYIYEKLDKKKSIVQLLDQLYDGLLMKEISNIEQFRLLKFTAFQLLSIDAEKSKELFVKIDLTEGNNNAHERSPLVEAILGGEASSLKSVESLVSDVDVESLILQGLEPLTGSGVRSTTSKVASNKVVINNKGHRGRTKPKRLPKNLSKTIDEERWLPLKDRSYYRSKKSKHNKTQGGVADETLDISEVPEEVAKPKKKSKKKKGKRN